MVEVVTTWRRPPRRTLALWLRFPDREKDCPGCGRTLPVARFYVLKRWPCGMPRLYQSYCRDCQADARRYQQGMKRIGRPYRPRPKGAGMTREEYLAVRRMRHAEKSKDPEWVENRRRKAREAARRRREGR